MTKTNMILEMLRKGPKTQWELCEGAKTARYGGRVFELRKRGYEIDITKAREKIGDKWITHFIYTLVREPGPMLPKTEPIPAEKQMGLL